jgi:hypothetical protein
MGLDADASGGKQADYACPIPDTHDKFEEAHYFLHRAISEFHLPEMFRWNLNAFLQALQSVTSVLRSELAHRPGFKPWYATHSQEMMEDALLRRFLDGRNLIVHRRRLLARSTAHLGAFRGTRLKRALELPVDVDMPSADALRRFAGLDIGFLGADHESGELLGIRRRWVVDELSEETEDLILTCHRAWTRVGTVVRAAHEWRGGSFPGYEEDDARHIPPNYDLLLEVDVPGLSSEATKQRPEI